MLIMHLYVLVISKKAVIRQVNSNTDFHNAVFNDLKHQAGKLNDIQKYVVLMLDEVSIKDDLVYDKVTEELVGFVNLGNDVDDCYTIRNKEKNIGTPNIATHALVFMVTSIIAAWLKCSLVKVQFGLLCNYYSYSRSVVSTHVESHWTS